MFVYLDISKCNEEIMDQICIIYRPEKKIKRVATG